MKDQLVKTLNKYGYMPVLLPSTGLVPPDLYLYAKPHLVRIGSLADVVRPGVAFRVDSRNLSDIESELKSRKSISGAFEFLKDVFAVLGVTMPKIDLSLEGSQGLEFAFTNVTSKSVDPIEIAKCLPDLEIPDDISPVAVGTGGLHIAYEYAYCTTLKITRQDGKKFSGSFTASIKGLVELKPKVDIEIVGDTVVTFSRHKGGVPAFAYKAGQLEQRLKPGEKVHWNFKPGTAMGLRQQAPEWYLPVTGQRLKVEDRSSLKNNSPRETAASPQGA